MPGPTSSGPPRRPEEGRPVIRYALISVLLALPQSIAALADLHKLSQENPGTVGWLLALISAAAPYCLAILLPLLWLFYFLAKRNVLPDLLRPLISRSWFCHDPIECSALAPYYTFALKIQPHLLDLSPKALAQAVDLPWLVAWYLLKRPIEMLRPELWPRLTRALLLPPGYLEHGGPYGDEMTVERLRRYHRLELAKGYTPLDIDNADPAKRSSMLRRAERQRCESLGIEKVES